MRRNITLFYTPDEDNRLDYFERIVLNMVQVMGNLGLEDLGFRDLGVDRIKKDKKNNRKEFLSQPKLSSFQNFYYKLRNLNLPTINYERNIDIQKFTEKTVKKIQEDGQCRIKIILNDNMINKKIRINTYYYRLGLDCILNFTKSLLVINNKINLTLGYYTKFDKMGCFYFQIKTSGLQSGLSVINSEKLFQPMFYNNSSHDDVKFITMYFFLLVRKLKGTICFNLNNTNGEAYFKIFVPVKTSSQTLSKSPPLPE